MALAVVGANWGDEGKGKVTDYLAKEVDIVCRFQGGANAGHTIINEYGRFVNHIIPSGCFNQNSINYIGNGVAFDIPQFIKEFNEVVSRNVPRPKIAISDRVQVMMPYHKLFDTYEEERLAGRSFGSTRSGIAPFYSDKYAKIGFQLNELYDDEHMREKLTRILEVKNITLRELYHKDPIKVEDIMAHIKEWREYVKPYLVHPVEFIHKAVKEGKKILLEGQLGSLKDPDYGIYPMTTSSHAVAGFGCIGAGIPPYYLKRIVVVTKAYSSAVGAGAFVSEIFGEEAEELRKRGGDKGEYGATTGRPRRVGWYDCVASRYGVMVQNGTEVAITVVDALSYLDEIPLCVAYEVDGKQTTEFPTTLKLEKAKPVWKKLPGWKSDTRGIRNYDELPENCRKYIEFIEEQLQCPITIVSNGPAREDIILRKH